LHSQKTNSQKKIWLLVYGGSATSITHDMMAKAGAPVDECYTLSDGVFRYTLVHLVKRVRKPAVERVMLFFELEYHIIRNSLYDCESILSSTRGNSDTDMHKSTPFIWFLKCMNERGFPVEEWIQPGNLPCIPCALI
jgi:hypothetical protein